MFSPKQPALILENDAMLVTGSDVLEAFDRLEVLEIYGGGDRRQRPAIGS